jgi:ribosomal protein L11 methylase PrmA
VQTPPEVVHRMLALAGVGPRDVLCDLGSGDGRIVIAAARLYGIRAVGFELDEDLVTESRTAIRQAGLQDLAEIRTEDLLTADLSPASTVTLYLYPAANLLLQSRIIRLMKRGSRVVSHEFGMGDWRPAEMEQMRDAAAVPRALYLWRI